MLLVGSRALKVHCPDAVEGLGKDIDLICTREEGQKLKSKLNVLHSRPTRWGEVLFATGLPPVELEYVENTESGKLIVEAREDNGGILTCVNKIIEAKVADLDTLYWLKMSHRYLKNSPHFHKTMRDILALRARHLIGEAPEWFAIRESETLSYGHPSLKVKKSDFFTSNVNYVYDHDSLHEAIAIHHQPAYTYFQEEGSEVYCSRQKFLECDGSIHLASVVEEACVLALERHQIPNDFRPDPEKSFLIALQKVCTSITSGWWREFAWEHYHRVVEEFHAKLPDYVGRFRDGLRNGTVKPYMPVQEHEANN